MRASWLIFSMLIILLAFIDLSIFYLFIKPTLKSNKIKRFVKDLHWVIFGIFILAFLAYTLFIPRMKGPEMYIWFSRLIASFALVYLPKIVLLFFSLLGAIRYIITKLIMHSKKRKYFYINKIGVIVSIFFFVIMLYGFSVGRYNYRVKTVEVYSDKLPESFDGFKIVQISDFHLGSFGKNYPGVKKAINLVNAQNPDIITFTGDMVNTFSSEMLIWMDDISKLKAKYGKYSVLGNHDYGHYVKWDTPEQDSLNIANLIKYQKQVGFDVLNNEHRFLKFGQDSINIVGVENWGLPPFPAYGKLDVALKDVNPNAFTLLLSHDSNHWDAQVKAKEVDLMLAGHTHAMQMGIEIGSFKWSPSKYIFKYWDGLYKDGEKYLYVNRGLGYIGLPGRIMQRPEITVIILKKKKISHP